MTRRCRQGSPLIGFDEISRNAQAHPVGHGQIEHAARIALIGRGAKPAERFRTILRHAFAARIHKTEIDLSP